MNILDKIVASTKQRLDSYKNAYPFHSIRSFALSLPREEISSFELALKEEGLRFICEVKRASPSKGIIAKAFNHLEIARLYEKAGAAAISCLSEPEFFLGSDKYLQEIASTFKIPVLRKDFIIDAYMIYQSKILGASAILLIASILSKQQLEEYLAIAKTLGLGVLLEVHNEEEAQRALEVKAPIIGVNNRDLKTFEVDISTSIRLKSLIGDRAIFVSESGIDSIENIRLLKQSHISAFLVGEWFVKGGQKALEVLRGID